MTRAGLAYFSLVTMTTLGYGDVVPVAPVARSLALLQAIFGQLYVAMAIAWVVGVHASRSAGGAGRRESGPG